MFVCQVQLHWLVCPKAFDASSILSLPTILRIPKDGREFLLRYFALQSPKRLTVSSFSLVQHPMCLVGCWRECVAGLHVLLKSREASIEALSVAVNFLLFILHTVPR